MRGCLFARKETLETSFCPNGTSGDVFFVRTRLLEDVFSPERAFERCLFVQASLLETSFCAGLSFEAVFLSRRLFWRPSAVFLVRTSLLETSFCPAVSSADVFSSERIFRTCLFVRMIAGSGCLLVRTCASHCRHRRRLSARSHDPTFCAEPHLQRCSPHFRPVTLYPPRSFLPSNKSYKIVTEY